MHTDHHSHDDQCAGCSGCNAPKTAAEAQPDLSALEGGRYRLAMLVFFLGPAALATVGAWLGGPSGLGQLVGGLLGLGLGMSGVYLAGHFMGGSDRGDQ